MKNIKITTIAVLSFFLLFNCTTSLQNDSFVHSLPATADTNVILPPAWAFGILYGSYTNQQETKERIDQIIDHDYPIDAYWIDSWIWDWKNKGKGPAKYIDFVADTVSYPNMQEMWSFMEGKNIKGGIWIWDAIMQTGNEAEYADFKSKGFFKGENIRTDGWHNGARTTIIGDNSESVNGTWCGDIDFEKPQAVAYFKQKVKPFFDKGVDFIKLDKTDAIPVCKAMFELSQQLGKESGGRGFVLSHSHGVDNEEYKRYPGKWTDDTRSDWNVESPTHEFSPWLPYVAFKENLAMYTDTTRHFYKIPFMANDMGGFSIGTDGLVDEELYIRWLQFAVFVPLTTPFSQPENQTGNIAFNVSERADTLFRQYAHLKMELFPYIYSYAHLSRLTGVNTIRPINGLLTQYLFGEEMLVAPVVQKGSLFREVYLPEKATWINFWSGEKYSGGQTITVDAPLQQIPLFIKAGAIIPKRNYARSIESGTNNLLELQVYDGDNGEFILIEDDGISNDYLDGIYAQTKLIFQTGKEESVLLLEPVLGSYNQMPNEREWVILLQTSGQLEKVVCNGKNFPFSKTNKGYKTEAFKAQQDELQKVVFKFI